MNADFGGLHDGFYGGDFVFDLFVHYAPVVYSKVNKGEITSRCQKGYDILFLLFKLVFIIQIRLKILHSLPSH